MTLASGKLSKREPINLMERRNNYFPKRFAWRGRRYDVYTVERAWTTMRRKGAQHYFRVHCREGTFDIVEDTGRKTWYLTAQVA